MIKNGDIDPHGTFGVPRGILVCHIQIMVVVLPASGEKKLEILLNILSCTGPLLQNVDPKFWSVVPLLQNCGFICYNLAI